MNLVIGATGNLGREICRRLVADRREPVIALVRESADPSKLQALQEMGVGLVYGDLRDPVSLQKACIGVNHILCTVSSMPFSYVPGHNDIENVDVQGITDLIHAASHARVSHFIYTSISGGMDQDFPLRNAKRTIEQRLKDSGMRYTILRPSYFMEVWLSPAVGFDPVNGTAQLYGRGDKPISWISLFDVAQIAVDCLKYPAAINTTLEVGGPEALTPLQVVQIFEEVSGKQFKVSFAPVEALQAQLKEASDPMQKSFVGLMLCYADGDPIDTQKNLKAFPIELTSVQNFAHGMVIPA